MEFQGLERVSLCFRGSQKRTGSFYMHFKEFQKVFRGVLGDLREALWVIRRTQGARRSQGFSGVFLRISGNFRGSQGRLRWPQKDSGGSQEESEIFQESCWEVSGRFYGISESRRGYQGNLKSG